MSGLATKETNRSVDHFIDSIENPIIKKDSEILLSIMEEITQAKPKVWGNERIPDFIIGFGKYTYERKGNNNRFEWFQVGFAPRNNQLTIHLNCEFLQEDYLIHELGKFKAGKSCLYIRKLADINLDFLIQLLDRSILYREEQAKTLEKND